MLNASGNRLLGFWPAVFPSVTFRNMLCRRQNAENHQRLGEGKTRRKPLKSPDSGVSFVLRPAFICIICSNFTYPSDAASTGERRVRFTQIDPKACRKHEKEAFENTPESLNLRHYPLILIRPQRDRSAARKGRYESRFKGLG